LALNFDSVASCFALTSDAATATALKTAVSELRDTALMFDGVKAETDEDATAMAERLHKMRILLVLYRYTKRENTVARGEL
jgi:hypothetical protein